MPLGTWAYGTVTYGEGEPGPGPTFPTVSIEIAFPNSPYDSSFTWTDIAEYVESVRCRVGRSRELERYAAGTATVVAETKDGRFDPIDPGSPYDGTLLPRKPIRCVATWNGIDYPLFFQFTEDFDVNYQGTPTVTIPASDWFALLADNDLLDPYTAIVKAAGPRAWWRLGDEENQQTTTIAGDSSDGGGNDGVYHGSPGFGVDVGPWGEATGVSFDGGEYIDFPPSAAVTDQFLIEGTFATDVTDFAALGADVDGMYLFSQGTTTLYNLSTYYASTRGIQIALNRDGGTITLRACGTSIESSVGNLNDGDPHLLRATWDGTTLRLMIDGVVVGSTTTIPDPTTRPAAAVRLGRHSSATNAGYDWVGSLRDWQTSDVPLSAAEFADRYEAWKHGWRGDTSGERIERILDLANVPASMRDIDTGNSTLTGARFGTKALEEMQRTAVDTEDGVLVVAPDGKVTFRERHARLFTPYTESQATFYDDDDSNPADALMYENVDPARPLDAIRNHVELTPEGGDKQIDEDDASVDKYGEQPYVKTTLHDSNNAARDALNWILIRYGDPAARFRSITLTPYGQEQGMFPQMLGRQVGDRITVVRHLLSGDTFEQDCHIEGIEHRFDGYGRWETTWQLSPADETTFWILGDATYGVLGSTTRLAA